MESSAKEVLSINTVRTAGENSMPSQVRSPSTGLRRTFQALSLAVVTGVAGLAGVQGCNSEGMEDACLKGSVLCGTGATAGTGGENVGGNGGGGNSHGGNAGNGGENVGGNAGNGGTNTAGNGGAGGENVGGNAGNGGTNTAGNGGAGGENVGGNAGNGGTNVAGNGGNGGENAGGNAGNGGTNIAGNGGTGGENVGGNGAGGEGGGGPVGADCINHSDCQDELLCCDDKCIEQSTENCGFCEKKCDDADSGTLNKPFCIPSTMTCESGCYGKYSDCNNDGICRDTSADNLNCGGCGNKCCTTCNPAQTCHAGGPSNGYCSN